MSSAQAQRLRERLLDPVAAARTVVPGSGIAAVLAPLWERDGELVAVFIKRHGELRLHAGQISFPGGRRDPGDVDLTATALREAHEEIGLEPAAVTRRGRAHADAHGRDRHRDLPVRRVDRAPGAHGRSRSTKSRRCSRRRCGELAATHRLQTFQRPRGPVSTDAYTIEGETIWGATGRIVADLLARLDGAGS